MTSKQQLENFVTKLSEQNAALALEILQSALPIQAHAMHRQLPAFVGIGRSNKGNLSTTVDQILAEGFGR